MYKTPGPSYRIDQQPHVRARTTAEKELHELASVLISAKGT
ncbi:hypothetical protein ABIB81_008566 [Bradyrhizobium sp. I1.7.5]